MVCLALELVGPWVVLGFSVGREAFDELLSINVPWSQEFSGVLQDLDLSLLPLVFSLILTLASRLLHRYSTNDKKSRLKMISFSTVRDTWRGSQSYVEKRREIEVTRRRKGRIKMGESSLTSNQFPMCSPQSHRTHSLHRTTQRCSRSYTEKRRRRKETEVARRIKGREESKGERQIQPVISSLIILHRLEHTKRFTELGREEKGEGEDRGDLVEKKERAVKPVISLPSKNGY